MLTNPAGRLGWHPEAFDQGHWGKSMTTRITPQQYGVGARFTLSVYDSDYVRIILDALSAADPTGLEIDTGDISTFISGSEQRILEYLAEVISAAAATGVHVSASILLSRGCPGELQCELPPGVAALGADPIRLASVGQRARAHWSLYPLLDAIKDDATSAPQDRSGGTGDRKSTRLNSSHVAISYAVFCLKKQKSTMERN